SVCWIDEIWAASLPKYRHWLEALNRFDHVFVGYSGSVDPLSKALGRPCHWLPGGVDTLRFTPYTVAPNRAVDVYSIGRRWEGIHQALLALAAKSTIFYVHDTFRGSEVDVLDHRQHREVLANIAKRSR